MTSRSTSRRLTVQEAAGVLGASVDAVRMRVRRGSLRSEKDEYGRVYVWVDPDESETSRETQVDGGPLVEVLRSQVEDLRVRLDRSEQANAEMRRIVAGLVQRVPELEAPSEPPGAAETVSDGPEGPEPRPDTGGAQEGAERVSWWRRMFGG